VGCGAVEFGGAEFSGGEVEQGDCRCWAVFVEGGEEVVLFLAECGVECRAGGEDACDFATDDLLGELGVFHLFADGDAETFAQQALQIPFGCVVGDAAHGDGAFAVAGGEGDLQLAGGDEGVVVEELVEVAHAEEEQGVGVFLLGRCPLAHEWG